MVPNILKKSDFQPYDQIQCLEVTLRLATRVEKSLKKSHQRVKCDICTDDIQMKSTKINLQMAAG